MIVIGMLLFVALCTAGGVVLALRVRANPVVFGAAGFGGGILVSAFFLFYAVWLLR
jgi:hypothetical protein